MQKIKSIIDVRKLGDGGIGVHIETLVDGLIELPEFRKGELELTLLADPKDLKRKSGSARDCLAKWRDVVEIVPEPSRKYSFSEHFILGLRQKSLIQQHSVYHAPHFTLPFFLGIPGVVTVHDLIHINAPDKFYHRIVARLMIKTATYRASHIILVSRASRWALRRTFGFKVGRKSVIPNAYRYGLGKPSDADVSRVRAKLTVPEKFVLFVGSERPHKGFAELLEAWRKISQEPELGSFNLLVVGGRFSKKLKKDIAKSVLSDRVQFMGSLSHEEINTLYHESTLVVVPSREEGFGLVALEAMKCGVPVVCSPAKSLVEVCGEAGNIAENFGEEALFSELKKVLLGGDSVDRKRKLGILRARQFSREAVAQKTLRVYQKVLGIEVTVDSSRRTIESDTAVRVGE